MEQVARQYVDIAARHRRLVAALAAIQEEETRAQIESAILVDTRRRLRGAANGHAARNPPVFRTHEACANAATGGGFEREHAVPLNLLHDALLGRAPGADGVLPVALQDPAEILRFLQFHLFHGLVTRDQHRLLNAFSMPEGWTWYMDPMARYAMANIAFHRAGECVHCGLLTDEDVPDEP